MSVTVILLIIGAVLGVLAYRKWRNSRKRPVI